MSYLSWQTKNIELFLFKVGITLYEHEKGIVHINSYN